MKGPNVLCILQLEMHTLSLLLIACTNFSEFSVKTKNR